MARLVLPSRLELKRPEGSSSAAPLAKVVFTTLLYVSPVQMIPACDHTGTFPHFHSSTTSGSASLMIARTRASVSPRQSLSSLILASMSCDAESFPPPWIFFVLVFFIFLCSRNSMLRIRQRQIASVPRAETRLASAAPRAHIASKLRHASGPAMAPHRKPHADETPQGPQEHKHLTGVNGSR